MRRRLTKEKQLEIENAALREAIESALTDLADDECNASIRIMSAKFTLAGANHRAKDRVQKYIESTKRGPL